MSVQVQEKVALDPPIGKTEEGFRVGVAQIKPSKADYRYNLERLGALFQQITDEGKGQSQRQGVERGGREDHIPDSANHLNTSIPQQCHPSTANARRSMLIDVLVLPETALTGYFLQGGVREVAIPAEQLLHDLSRTYAQCEPSRPMDICLGFYEQDEGKFYNSALYATLEPDPLESRLIHVHRKFFLPTYGVFDEERFVARGRRIDAFQTRFGKAAILICEDVWHSISPIIAALKGARVIYVPSASPARGFRGVEAANITQYRRMLTQIAEEHTIYAIQSSLVGFEGGKGFSGGSIIANPFGQVMLEGPFGEEALLIGQISFDDLRVARAQHPLLSDLESVLADVLVEMQKLSSGEW